MLKKIIVLFSMIVLSALAWFANLTYPNENLVKLFYSFATITLIYSIFNISLEFVIDKNVKESRTRFSSRKATSIVSLLIILAVLIGIWIKDPQSLLVAYGLIGAGLAISLQDFFKNFVGGIMIITNKIYKIGDRIEINSKFGDVMDIGVMYTTLLEIKEWVGGDQATGRLTIIPNSTVLSNPVNNYTKDHNFIWDEITVPITYDSDWKTAHKNILELVAEETKQITEQANREILKLEEKYYLEKRPTEPAIFIKLTDNWISFNIRYISETRNRRILHNKLSHLILEMIEKNKKIKIASETIDIVGFPKK
ncbi:MAG: mechanosensitive ion channel domain-containing protein [Nanoarchaeota archaeon]|nr:mechanosensitive ion channel family protein [Nanoarchaeota archaeon]MBU4300888.1 mechanosensitive ion channel family protein [Nanoarchaeota archaeon]MBU4451406.1 mechanosensitive ion channel family protein [Nanoarchaeota archaeon]MCG2724520.1 mechanosensitive ion channel family protein [archaeon]